MAERKSVSMQDLADKLGISKVTVSKALNGKDGVGEELKEKIFALARESGYVLPDYGKRKSKKVGIIMSPRFSSGDEGKFYMAMYERIIYELQRASCSSIMISPTTATLPSDMNTIQTRGLFDGLIFLGILDKGVREQIAQIDLPKVYVDIYDRTHKSDSVITENIYSSYELTNYLIQQGHTDIGFVRNRRKYNQYFRPISRISAENAGRREFPRKMSGESRTEARKALPFRFCYRRSCPPHLSVTAMPPHSN